MKKLMIYKCDICNKLYNSEIEALNCEDKGKELPLVQIGQKVLYKDEWNGGMGTSYDELYVINIENRGHYISYSIGTEECCPYYTLDGNDEFNESCTIIK